MKLLQPKTEPAAKSSDTSTSRSAIDIPERMLDDVGRICKLLADDTRLRILYYLTQCPELHVRALCELLGESQPAVSHHLALLREAGLLDRRREGKHNFYSLQTRGFTRLLDMLFANLPEGNRRVRFEEYVLSHSPA